MPKPVTIDELRDYLDQYDGDEAVSLNGDDGDDAVNLQVAFEQIAYNRDDDADGEDGDGEDGR